MKLHLQLFSIGACLAIAAASSFAAKVDGGYPRVMQGPMIGIMQPTEATIWSRLSGPYECVIEYSLTPDFSEANSSQPATASKSDDYCVVSTLSGLQPATTYYYRVLVNGGVSPYRNKYAPFRFKTAPEGPASFRVAFGSCARVQEDPVQPIWRELEAWSPDLFFWLGDNIYGDALDSDILAEEYRRQRDVPFLQPLIRSIPHLAVWDDHDFGLNDHDRTHPGKSEALKVFKNYWPNGAYGTPEAPGVYFIWTYGGVDFFFLDCRYHRSPNTDEDDERKTLLGPLQLQWLKDGLSQSEAPFKVLISGSGWSAAKGPGGDSWAAFMTERNELFNFIRDEEISGVVLLSGDTHVGELNCIPWSEHGGYDLYDLVSSPIAQTPGSGWTERRPERRIRQVFAASPNIGILDFDMSGEPTLRFNLIDVYGRLTWQPFELKASDLVNGRETWRETMDSTSRHRYERTISGQGYYEPAATN